MTDKELSCKLCNYKTTLTADWMKHIKSQKHQRNGEKKYYCNICDIVFFSKLYQDKHLSGKVHLNKIKIQENLKEIETHYDEKHL